MKRLISLEEKGEDHLLQMTKSFEIGIDEVGRGCIFGPVFSAAIVISKNKKITYRSAYFEKYPATQNSTAFILRKGLKCYVQTVKI